MEISNILTADVLDIIFDERNKDYGAYDLRKNYQRRLTKAVIVTSTLVVLVCVTYVVLGSMKFSKEELVVDRELSLDAVKPPPAEKKIELPPPPKVIEPPVVKTIQFTKPLIVDVDPPENERPPEQTDLVDAKIGTVNHDGKDFDGTIMPPVEESKGVVEAPKKHDDAETIFTKVEIESDYPGGMRAWAAFLNRNLVYPQEAVDITVEGVVNIRFVVDAQGNVSDVTAISGPEELRKAAVTVIKKSGKWTPAIQNGNKVKSYKTQPIVFKLSEG